MHAKIGPVASLTCLVGQNSFQRGMIYWRCNVPILLGKQPNYEGVRHLITTNHMKWHKWLIISLAIKGSINYISKSHKEFLHNDCNIPKLNEATNQAADLQNISHKTLISDKMWIFITQTCALKICYKQYCNIQYLVGALILIWGTSVC